MSKIVCYFSASGNTRSAANKLSNVLNCDIFEIKPEKLYTSADLDWTNDNSRSSVEMRNNIKPRVSEKLQNIDEYDTILLGFPIWWYKAPTIINTFIEENNLSGKKIYVFATSGSSSVDESINNLRNTYKELNFVSAMRFTNLTSESEILDFITK